MDILFLLVIGDALLSVVFIGIVVAAKSKTLDAFAIISLAGAALLCLQTEVALFKMAVLLACQKSHDVQSSNRDQWPVTLFSYIAQIKLLCVLQVGVHSL